MITLKRTLQKGPTIWKTGLFRNTTFTMAPALQKQLEKCLMSAEKLASVKESAVLFLFQRFRFGNLDLQNNPHGWQETLHDNEQQIVEMGLSQTTSEPSVIIYFS